MREAWQSYEFGMQICQADSAFVPFPIGASKKRKCIGLVWTNRKKQEKHRERSGEEENMDLEQYEELAAEVRRAVCTSLIHCLCWHYASSAPALKIHSLVLLNYCSCWSFRDKNIL